MSDDASLSPLVPLLAILLLLVTVIYPTYFAWPVNLIPLLLAGYLIFLGVVRAI